ncbi:hypothetical protein D3C84_988600 [compost metagenome]
MAAKLEIIVMNPDLINRKLLLPEAAQTAFCVVLWSRISDGSANRINWSRQLLLIDLPIRRKRQGRQYD